MAGLNHATPNERLADAEYFYGRDADELRVAAANLDDGWLPTPEEATAARGQTTINSLARSAWVASVIDYGDHLL